VSTASWSFLIATAPIFASKILLLRGRIVELRKSTGVVILDLGGSAVAIQATEPSSDTTKTFLYTRSAIRHTLERIVPDFLPLHRRLRAGRRLVVRVS